jgi:hypothetical protein
MIDHPVLSTSKVDKLKVRVAGHLATMALAQPMINTKTAKKVDTK